MKSGGAKLGLLGLELPRPGIRRRRRVGFASLVMGLVIAAAISGSGNRALAITLSAASASTPAGPTPSATSKAALAKYAQVRAAYQTAKTTLKTANAMPKTKDNKVAVQNAQKSAKAAYAAAVASYKSTLQTIATEFSNGVTTINATYNQAVKSAKTAFQLNAAKTAKNNAMTAASENRDSELRQLGELDEGPDA
jgi:hypothetical protein